MNWIIWTLIWLDIACLVCLVLGAMIHEAGGRG